MGKTATTTSRRYKQWGREGGNSGYRHVYGAVAALTEIVHMLSVFDGGEDSNASSALGCAGGGRY